MKLFKIFLTIFAAFFVEAILDFKILFVRLEIILLVLVFFSLKVNMRNAILLGCFAGLLKDIIAFSPFGQHVLIFGLVAYALNRTKRIFYEVPDYIPIIASAVAILFCSLAFLSSKFLFSNANLNLQIILYIFMIILVNTALSPLVFKILKNAFRYS